MSMERKDVKYYLEEKDVTQEFFGWSGFIFNLYFLFIPAIPFYKVIKGELAYEEAPIVYSIMNYISCVCWLLYSDMLYSEQITKINFLGLISHIIFISIYFFYELKKLLIDTLINILLLLSLTYAILLTLSTMESDTLYGKICAGVYCLQFLFPIQSIYRVIKQKNYMFIPFFTSLCSFFMSFCWLIYGIMITEFYVVFPHCLNIILALIQITIFFIYRNKYPIFIEQDFASSTLEMDNNINEKKEEEKKKEEKYEEKIPIVKEKPDIIFKKEIN